MHERSGERTSLAFPTRKEPFAIAVHRHPRIFKTPLTSFPRTRMNCAHISNYERSESDAGKIRDPVILPFDPNAICELEATGYRKRRVALFLRSSLDNPCTFDTYRTKICFSLSLPPVSLSRHRNSIGCGYRKRAADRRTNQR